MPTLEERKSRCPITQRLHETRVRMETYGIRDEPLLLTKREFPLFLRELPMARMFDKGIHRAILSGGSFTYAGYEVKII